MSRRQYLKDRAAKAERLAQTIMDTLTVQRLREIATEFRAEAEQFSTEGLGKPTRQRRVQTGTRRAS
jgi:hypothetical protein